MRFLRTNTRDGESHSLGASHGVVALVTGGGRGIGKAVAIPADVADENAVKNAVTEIEPGDGA